MYAALVSAILTASVAAAPCPDLNADGKVDVHDLLILLSQWGPCDSPCPSDITRSGSVGVFDLLALLSAWGKVECDPPQELEGSMILTFNGEDVRRSVESTLLASNFSLVAWVHKTELGTLRNCLSIRDSSNNEVLSLRLGGVNDNIVIARMVTSGTGGGTHSANASPFDNAVGQWLLVIATWNASTNQLQCHVAGDGDSFSASTTVTGDLSTPHEIAIAGSASWRGYLGAAAIRRGEILTLADAEAMYASRHRLTPVRYDNADLSQSGITAYTTGIVQLPNEDGVTAVNGARIGSAVVNGNFICFESGDSNISVVRPVTVSGSLSYERDTSGFFTPETHAVESGVVGNSAALKRWGDNDPDGQVRIGVAGNSRVVSAVSFAPASGKPDVPYRYAGSYAVGLALHNLDTFGGMMGSRILISGGQRWPGIDMPDPAWTAGSVSDNLAAQDFAREWLNSRSAGGPSQPILLSEDGELSIGARHLDGSLIDRAESLNVGVTYLRGPGCSDILFQGTEASAQNVRGDFVGSQQATNDANTTQFTHTFTAADDVTGTTLTIDGETLAVQVGWRVSVVSGTGYRSWAEVGNVAHSGGDTILTLRHAFGTDPATGSVLAFGPVSFGMASVSIGASSEDFKKIWVKHDGAIAANEIGAVLFAAHVWRSDVPCFIFAPIGWGGNGFANQMPETNSDVISRMVSHMQLGTVLLTDAYLGSISETFPAYAALVEAGGAQAVYTIGNSNNRTASNEAAYRAFAFGQETRAAICVTDSPLIGAFDERTTYSGWQNWPHPSIEAYVRVAAALAELAAEEFE